MLNILICDDEKPFLDRLANKITVYLENREIPFQMAAFCSGEELLKHNEDRLFDIAFLDISMNAVSGMDAAEYLRDRNRKICIVFVTGYMDYVLEGYKVGAFRYLVKDSLEISFEECITWISLFYKIFQVFTNLCKLYIISIFETLHKLSKKKLTRKVANTPFPVRFLLYSS